MSETKKGNPFLPENYTSGGGFWDDKIVTITKAFAEIHLLAYGDGSPVISQFTGEQSIQNVLSIVGIADDSEVERKESYAVGGIIPTADGEGFCDPKTGVPGFWRKDSKAARFADALAAAGFPVGLLYDDKTDRTKLSVLAGTKFRFKGTPRLDKDGKVKTNKKGYEQEDYFPVEFLGRVAGSGGGGGTTTPGTPAGAPLIDKAVETVIGILGAAGGKVSRAELVKGVSQTLAGDPDAGKIIALIAKDDFHKDKPWTRDGTGYTLGS